MVDLTPIITCIIVIGLVVLVVATLPIIFLLPTFLAIAWLYAYKLGC